jgi:hypothetical protein
MENPCQNMLSAIFRPANVAPGVAPDKRPLLLQCEVMFGSPSSNCGGNGICKIVASDRQSATLFERSNCQHTRAFITPSGEGAALIFRRDWLCANLMRRYLRHGILEMPESCPLPAGIVSATGLKMNELPAGLHLVEDYGFYLRVQFGSGSTKA